MLYASKAKNAADSRKARRILGMPVALFSTLAILVTGGVAWAAIAFTMTGSVQAEADNGSVPTISDEHFTGKFYPGAERDLVFTVKNDNEFPVTLTEVKGSLGELTSKCATYFTGPFFASKTGTVKVDAVVPAEKSITVTIPKALKLSAESPTGCAAKINLTVTGSGAGN